MILFYCYRECKSARSNHFISFVRSPLDLAITIHAVFRQGGSYTLDKATSRSLRITAAHGILILQRPRRDPQTPLVTTRLAQAQTQPQPPRTINAIRTSNQPSIFEPQIIACINAPALQLAVSWKGLAHNVAHDTLPYYPH